MDAQKEKMNVKIMVDDKEVNMNEFFDMIRSKSNQYELASFKEQCAAVLIRDGKINSGGIFGGRFDVECFGSDGVLKWSDHIDNLVVNEGLNHILDILFVSATGQVDPWYVGLTDGTPTIATGDTMLSHVGWAEDANYAGVRKAYIDVRSGQSVDNSASKASFAINATTTIGGAFMNSDDSATAGTLLCAGAFTGGDRSVVSGDILNVTYTFTAADDGV